MLTHVSGFKFQVGCIIDLPGSSTERSDGSPGQCLRTAAMVARDTVSWLCCVVSGFKFQDSGFRIQVSGFRFQASYYPTFFPAWKAVLSVAMAVRDATSVKFSENIKQGECDSPQRQLPKSIKCFCPTMASFVVWGHCRGRCQRLMDSCPFRVLVCVLRRDCECAWIGLLEHWEWLYAGRSDCKSDRAGQQNIIYITILFLLFSLVYDNF